MARGSRSRRSRAAPEAPGHGRGDGHRQREISISEFFTKNRHLLGFDNPSKALLTTIKEAVDNSLDACEEAGILPEISIEVRDLGFEARASSPRGKAASWWRWRTTGRAS